MEGGVIYPLHISLKGAPLDSSGLPMVSIVTVSGDGSQWRRAPSWGVELNDLGKRSRSLHVKLHPAFSGDIHFDLRLNSGDQFVFTLKVHVFFYSCGVYLLMLSVTLCAMILTIFWFSNILFLLLMDHIFFCCKQSSTKK